MTNRKLAYFLATAALLLTACVNDRVLEEERDITESTDPMRFSGQGVDEDNAHISRASTPLTTGFVVSTYKAFPTDKQQTVMQDYRVDYRVDGWNNNSLWEYAGVDGFQHDEQFLKFWDYANFPYRFHAIAPCPKAQSEFTLTDKKLSINVPYHYQTCLNGGITTRDAAQQLTDEEAEPYMVAQVERFANGIDKDIFAARDINTASTTRNREVWLPFHHLNSKIRFGVYSLADWATDHHIYIEDLVVKVSSPNFVVGADGYEATLSGDTDGWRRTSGTSGFTGVQTVMPPLTTEIFAFSGGKNVEGNDLHEAQTQRTAYMLLCPDGFIQMPQTNVTMTVSLKLMNPDGTLYEEFVDVPVHTEDDDYTFDWISGYRHTYYIVIGAVDDKLQIFFTATLAPWEDVSGQLETDLEK